MVENLWVEEDAFRLGDNVLNELIYRSNLLGTDRSVANWGGGNTSLKSQETDFRGQRVDVLWVKGSGSDLGTAGKQNFTALRLKELTELAHREQMSDEDMVDYISHCMLDTRQPRASIETLLHAFLPQTHIDHTHPDAIISICCADNGEAIAREIYGDRFVWVPYVRPGFTMSKLILEQLALNPQAELVLMAKHGLVTWGETSKACYYNTIAAVREAELFIAAKQKLKQVFGGTTMVALNAEQRLQIFSTLLPVIRGAVSQEHSMLLKHDDTAEVLQFVCSVEAKEVSQIGAACPDHLIHTKRIPLFVDWHPAHETEADLVSKLKHGIDAYKKAYVAYFERNAQGNEQMYDPYPRVILIPGIGMINTGKDHFNAGISNALYHRAIAVMRGSTALGNFVSLSLSASFHIEYWPMEVYKLSLAPPEKELSRKIALVTGGAGAIGTAICRRLAANGAHLVVADLKLEPAQQLAAEINQLYGSTRAIAVKMDVTQEADTHQAFVESIMAFGGIDFIVNNAGLATSNPIDQTSLAEWNLNQSVLGTGYFLVLREAFRWLKLQNRGGTLVFIGSKNSLYAGKDAAAYSSAKAAEAHLARCAAVEGGEFGIRVNTILPDAVISGGSDLWSEERRKDRAKVYGIEPDQLEEYYRMRTVLQVQVYPDDVAQAVQYFLSERSAKTTGCILTVDGGVAAVFTR